MSTSRFALLAGLALGLLSTACDDSEKLTQRSEVHALDPAIAAADIFVDAPADIPAEHAADTLALWGEARWCKLYKEGTAEICCSAFRCCENVSEANLYTCWATKRRWGTE